MREFKIYNTLSSKKEIFVPIQEGEVGIYACGPTVYNFFHLGNARPFITFDLLRRVFEYIGYKVTFVQNFTDVDDKVINRANEEGVSPKELSERYIREYFVDAQGLGIKPASFHPKATETVPEIIKMIESLIKKGYCYVAGDGVYYETGKFSEYGKLSHMPLEELTVGGGARAVNFEEKRHPEDFAVWKFAKEGEPSWESPWGDGRPGWHIECSAMSEKFLGKTIDIHCGGRDLIFPHHENEIAQSEAAHGCTFARYWMHNGFINIDKEKMSKSKGNFFTVRDLSKKYSYEVIRYFMLTGHYRSPINFSHELIENAQTALSRIKGAYSNLNFVIESRKSGENGGSNAEDIFSRYKEEFESALTDDLNTPGALAAVFSLVRELNTLAADPESPVGTLIRGKELLKELMGVLGFSLAKEEDKIPSEVLSMLQLRTDAKKRKDYGEADRLRNEILKAGYAVEDTPEGPKLSKN